MFIPTDKKIEVVHILIASLQIAWNVHNNCTLLNTIKKLGFTPTFNVPTWVEREDNQIFLGLTVHGLIMIFFDKVSKINQFAIKILPKHPTLDEQTRIAEICNTFVFLL